MWKGNLLSGPGKSAWKSMVIVICLVTILVSCNRQLSYNHKYYPKGTILKGQLPDERTLYLVRENDSANISGYSFIYSNNALVNLIPYRIDHEGNIIFTEKDTTYHAKIQANKKGTGMTLSLPAIIERHIEKQSVSLSFWDILSGNQLCKGRYYEQKFDSIIVHKDIVYGNARGFYTSESTDSIPHGDTEEYRRLILQDLKRSIIRQDSLPLLMDVYEPYDPASSKKPVFMFIHGGGFFLGDKHNLLQQSLTDDLVKRGYIVISINYRLGSTIYGVRSVEKLIYTGVQDARAALRYITHNHKELNIDPHQIYIGGSSAGAIISLYTAYMDNDEVFKSAERRRIRRELGDINTSGNRLTDVYSIAGVVSMWGAVVDLDIIDGRNADIPLLMFHGTADNIVPIDSGLPYQQKLDSRAYNRISTNWQLYGSECIYTHMKNLNMPVKLFTFEGYSHEPQVNKDGTYNNNILVIKKEMNNFMYKTEHHILKNYTMSGPKDIYPDTYAAIYEVSNADNSKISWSIEGGLLIEKSANMVKAVWYDTFRNGKISACITDESGESELLEASVKIYANQK